MAIIFTKVIVNGNYSHNKVYRVEGFDDSTPKQTVILQGDLKLCEYPNEMCIRDRLHTLKLSIGMLL